jgi:hypothetical protein
VSNIAKIVKGFKNIKRIFYNCGDSKLIPHMELKVPVFGRSFESTFLASYDVGVIHPELC